MGEFGKSGQPAGYIQHVNGTSSLQDVAKRAGDFMHSWYSNPETLKILEVNMRDAGIHYGSILGAYSPTSYNASLYAKEGLNAIDQTPVYFMGNNSAGSDAFIKDGRLEQLPAHRKKSLNKDFDMSKVDLKNLDETQATWNTNGTCQSGQGQGFGEYNYYTGKDPKRRNIRSGVVASPSNISYIYINSKSKKFNNPFAKIPLLVHEMTHGTKLAAPKVTLTNLMLKYGLQGEGSDAYADGAEEGYSKLNEIRSTLQLDPSKRNYSKEDIPKMMRRLKILNPDVYEKTYGRWSEFAGDKVDDFMSEMFNTVADNTILNSKLAENYFQLLKAKKGTTLKHKLHHKYNNINYFDHNGK